MTKKIQSIPEARLLLESLRSVGYNEETAIADIIDNCISAKAHEIKIQFDWEKKRIVISDDGLGMSSKDLIENMRIGSSDPNQVRDERDLGRFGMGMKTAAFSLGKKLTVVTKSNSTVSNASWDLEQIPSIGWNLIIRDESEISEFSSQIDEQGTVVIIENLDRVIDTDDEKKAKNKFSQIAITSWTRRGRQPRSRMEPQALSGTEGTAAVRLRTQRPGTIQTTPPGCGSRAFCGAVRSARQQRRGCPRR